MDEEREGAKGERTSVDEKRASVDEKRTSEKEERTSVDEEVCVMVMCRGGGAAAVSHGWRRRAALPPSPLPPSSPLGRLRSGGRDAGGRALLERRHRIAALALFSLFVLFCSLLFPVVLCGSRLSSIVLFCSLLSSFVLFCPLLFSFVLFVPRARGPARHGSVAAAARQVSREAW